MILKGKKVFVAGHSGLVGSALIKRLGQENCTLFTASHADLDLRSQADVNVWMAREKPDVVVIAAATVGGIGANVARPAAFIYDNLMIASNLIHAAHMADVERVLFLGSSCIYPRDAAQPITEEALLTGPLEPTNAPYAIAKIAGLTLIQSYRRQYNRAYISAMPCNLYGPHDRFDAQDSHVIPALMIKMRETMARGQDVLTLWGTGTPLREFLYAPDLADALVFLLKNYDEEIAINIGSGAEISIFDLAHKIAKIAGFTGRIVFDSAHPDGTPRKVLDCTRLTALGWRPRTSLDEGLARTWDWFCQKH